MNVLNKLRTTVSGALPGNPLIREYDILRATGSAGPGLCWKLYSAVKKTTKQEVTLWVMEKRILEAYNKNDRELVLEVLRHGVSQLTRLRHPRVVAVFAPMEESRESLAFATEPLMTSLANLVSPQAEGAGQEPAIEPPDEVEIRFGVSQISEALAFLHNDCRQVHGGLALEAILVTKAGAWKLAGFDYSASSAAMKAAIDGGEPVFNVSEWQSNIPFIAQPNLDSVSPETARQGRSAPSSDMYSLGMLLISIYGRGKPLFECRNELSAFVKNVKELKNLRLSSLQCVPESLREVVKLLLNPEPSLRPDALQFAKIPFFDDASTRTLTSLDNLFQLDNLAKSQFYKQLPNALPVLPKRVLLLRVFPQLSEDFANANMVPFVLPSVLHIAEVVNEAEFREHMVQKLLPIFSMTDPMHIALICLQNLSILLTKCPPEDVKNHILPMVTRSIDSSNPHLQEVCMRALPSVAAAMDYSSLKNNVIPKLKNLCLRCSDSQIRIKCLMCIGKMMEHTDKWFVLDEVIPMLPEIRSRDPELLMTILGIYRVAFSHKKLGITKELLATRVLPQLMPMMIESNLSLPQFSALINLIKEMMARVESEQRGKLQQLHNIQEEQKTLMKGADAQAGVPAPVSNGVSQSGSGKTDSASNSMMEQFMTALAPNSANAALSGPLFDASLGGGVVEELAAGAKASGLSLEAKQRLAAQTEQASRLHKAGQGTSGALAPSAHVPKAKPQPKDLTSTLMERNLASMAICAPPQQSPTSSSSALVPLSTSVRPYQQAQQPQQRQQIDMTSLDNLFGPGQAGAQQSRSLNEMRALTYPGFQAAPPQGAAGPGHMTSAAAGFGGFPGTGPGPFPAGSGQMMGTFGGPGPRPTGSNHFGMQGRGDGMVGASPLAQFQQQQQQQQRQAAAPLNSNDLNDLLG